jgi:hypothetical protein
MIKLIVAFHNSANEPKKYELLLLYVPPTAGTNAQSMFAVLDCASQTVAVELYAHHSNTAAKWHFTKPPHSFLPCVVVKNSINSKIFPVGS